MSDKTLFQEYATNEEQLMGANTTLTAHAGGGAGHLILINKWNIFTTVATDNDSADLPLALIGQECIIFNKGLHVIELFPNVVDQVNAGTITSILIAPSQCAILKSPADQNWIIVDTGSLNGVVLTSDITLSKSDILALDTTQKVIASAIGAGYALELITVGFKYTAGTSYYNGGSGFGIYADTSSVEQCGLPTGAMNTTTSIFQKVSTDDGELIDNKDLVIKCGAMTPFTDSGSTAGTVKIWITYRVITI